MQPGNTVPILPYPVFSISRYAAMATEVTKEAAVPPQETIKPAPQASSSAEEVTSSPVKEISEPEKNVVSFESFRATNDNVTFSDYSVEGDPNTEVEENLQSSLKNLDAETQPTIDIMV